MKYKVLKDVVVDGVSYKAGSEVDFGQRNLSRLIMLGYLAQELKPVMPEDKTPAPTNRAVKPKRKRNGS